MRATFRPLSLFPPEFHSPRQASQFKSGYSATMELLDLELHSLGARDFVIELAVTEADIRIRLDGMPRASARPSHPGVVVSFDSKHGPLRYGTDAFPHWEDNLRAIALGLEALRKVERYGIGKRGEQYQGWLALSAGSDPSPERGRRLIEKHGGVRAALHATHPDHGGAPAEFADVQAARAARA